MSPERVKSGVYAWYDEKIVKFIRPGGVGGITLFIMSSGKVPGSPPPTALLYTYIVIISPPSTLFICSWCKNQINNNCAVQFWSVWLLFSNVSSYVSTSGVVDPVLIKMKPQKNKPPPLSLVATIFFKKKIFSSFKKKYYFLVASLTPRCTSSKKMDTDPDPYQSQSRIRIQKRGSIILRARSETLVNIFHTTNHLSRKITVAQKFFYFENWNCFAIFFMIFLDPNSASTSRGWDKGH